MDRPSPALTVRAILALHHCREAPERTRYLSAIDRALDYLRQVQLGAGIWFSVVHTTAQVLDAYATLNRAREPTARKCRTWLLEHQHRDGSWAEDMLHPGTVEETAWALTALAASGVDAPEEALDRAATWLLQQQSSEGNWPPSVVCYYGQSARYSSDHIANGFALQALGRYHRQRKQHGSPS